MRRVQREERDDDTIYIGNYGINIGTDVARNEEAHVRLDNFEEFLREQIRLDEEIDGNLQQRTRYEEDLIRHGREEEERINRILERTGHEDLIGRVQRGATSHIMSVDQETYDRLYQRGELDPNAAYYIIDSQWFSHPTKPSKIEVKITYFID